MSDADRQVFSAAFPFDAKGGQASADIDLNLAAPPTQPAGTPMLHCPCCKSENVGLTAGNGVGNTHDCLVCFTDFTPPTPRASEEPGRLPQMNPTTALAEVEADPQAFDWTTLALATGLRKALAELTRLRADRTALIDGKVVKQSSGRWYVEIFPFPAFVTADEALSAYHASRRSQEGAKP